MSNDNEFENTGFYAFVPRGDGTKDDARYGKMLDVRGLASFNKPDSHKDNTELIEQLHKALEALTDSQKQAIDLIFFQEISIRDASKIARISKASMQDRYEQAVKALQRNVQNDTIRNG